MKNLAYIFITFISFSAVAQNVKTINLGGFDNRWYHFGMALSYNNSDFFIERDLDYAFGDSLITLNNEKQPGFNINIVASLKIGRGLSARFLPGISPKDRILKFKFLNADNSTSEFTKRVESFYLEFPVFLKYRSDRINNFAAYVIGGGKYAIDMQSQKDVNNQIDDDIVIKTGRREWALSAGGGFDFFLQYFKFGIELRMEYGLNNIFIDDGTKFSDPINSLRSKNFVLSFTFEG